MATVLVVPNGLRTVTLLPLSTYIRPPYTPVKEGHISRQAVPENRRTFIVKLSPKGRRFFQKMAALHEQWVISLLGELSMEDVNQIMGLLGKVKTTVG